MSQRFTILEHQLVEKLLKTVPRGFSGMLPFNEFEKTNEWKELLKVHSRGGVMAMCNRTWKKSVIPVETPKLNHGYNFCPACGFKLN